MTNPRRSIHHPPRMARGDQKDRHGAPSGVDDAVRIQQRMVRRYSRYVVQSVGRLQSGNFEVGSWVEAYGRLMVETADDVGQVLRALSGEVPAPAPRERTDRRRPD